VKTYLYCYRELLFIGKGILEENVIVELTDAYQCFMVHTQVEGGIAIGFRFIKLGEVQINEEGVIVELSTASPFYEQYVHENSGIIPAHNVIPLRSQQH
jgi:hypothetical protein